jgi:5'-nucleotidase
VKLLLSNDDGVYAPGLAALEKQLSEISDTVVFAPDRNRSGASNSLTLTAPLQVRQLPNGFYSVEGTPTDCVHLALTGLLDELPAMVVSGINDGPNMGDDVWYSGTVAAAMEGRFLGVSSIAVSLSGDTNFDTAAAVAVRLVKQLMDKPLPPNTILNVNVPDVPFDQLAGYSVTRLGTRHMAEPTIKMTDPRGNDMYWIGPAGPEQDAGEGTDFHAVNHNYVSITPLRVDITERDLFVPLQAWLADMV